MAPWRIREKKEKERGKKKKPEASDQNFWICHQKVCDAKMNKEGSYSNGFGSDKDISLLSVCGNINRGEESRAEEQIETEETDKRGRPKSYRRS